MRVFSYDLCSYAFFRDRVACWISCVTKISDRNAVQTSKDAHTPIDDIQKTSSDIFSEKWANKLILQASIIDFASVNDAQK